MKQPRRPLRRRQAGVALIFALVILLVLTLLGVSALRISTFEQLMAGNTQEINRAFQAAESGMVRSLADPNNFSSMSSIAINEYTFSEMGAEVAVETELKQITSTRRSSNPTGQGTADFAHFDQKATATTNAGARTVLHQGVRKNIPKAN